jgi:hypothetical protein
VLDHWHRVKAGQSGDAVIVTDYMTAGGGWDGPNADDDKVAVVSGWLVADPPLDASTPPPGQVEWSDGSDQQVELISAADALQGLIHEAGNQKCDGCVQVVVTGAHLSTASHTTTRGVATLPVWEFEFQPAHEPMVPVSYVAVKGALSDTQSSLPDGGEWVIDYLDEAYGDAQSTELSVTFVGSPWAGDNPCGADYSAQAVESDEAVAIVLIESHRWTGDGGVACPAVGARRTAVAHLASPLGDRVVLEIRFGTPVTLVDAPPPTDNPQN